MASPLMQNFFTFIETTAKKFGIPNIQVNDISTAVSVLSQINYALEQSSNSKVLLTKVLEKLTGEEKLVRETQLPAARIEYEEQTEAMRVMNEETVPKMKRENESEDLTVAQKKLVDDQTQALEKARYKVEALETSLTKLPQKIADTGRLLQASKEPDYFANKAIDEDVLAMSRSYLFRQETDASFFRIIGALYQKTYKDDLKKLAKNEDGTMLRSMMEADIRLLGSGEGQDFFKNISSPETALQAIFNYFSYIQLVGFAYGAMAADDVLPIIEVMGRILGFYSEDSGDKKDAKNTGIFIPDSSIAFIIPHLKLMLDGTMFEEIATGNSINLENLMTSACPTVKFILDSSGYSGVLYYMTTIFAQFKNSEKQSFDALTSNNDLQPQTIRDIFKLLQSWKEKYSVVKNINETFPDAFETDIVASQVVTSEKKHIKTAIALFDDNLSKAITTDISAGKISDANRKALLAQLEEFDLAKALQDRAYEKAQKHTKEDMVVTSSSGKEIPKEIAANVLAVFFSEMKRWLKNDGQLINMPRINPAVVNELVSIFSLRQNIIRLLPDAFDMSKTLLPGKKGSIEQQELWEQVGSVISVISNVRCLAVMTGDYKVRLNNAEHFINTVLGNLITSLNARSQKKTGPKAESALVLSQFFAMISEWLVGGGQLLAMPDIQEAKQHVTNALLGQGGFQRPKGSKLTNNNNVGTEGVLTLMTYGRDRSSSPDSFESANSSSNNNNNYSSSSSANSSSSASSASSSSSSSSGLQEKEKEKETISLDELRKRRLAFSQTRKE